jgi:type IV pilus assembly protein PilA
MRGLIVRKHAGFTLIELLIVVAIIAIIAAIAIPALLRARISANESASLGDIRTVHSAQTAYQGVNGGYYEGAFTCMSQKGGCIPGAPPITSPTYLDKVLSVLAPKGGYTRSRENGPPPVPLTADVSATSITSFVYTATPLAQGMTGVRGFAIDASGRICFTPDGLPPPTTGTGILANACTPLK